MACSPALRAERGSWPTAFSHPIESGDAADACFHRLPVCLRHGGMLADGLIELMRGVLATYSDKSRFGAAGLVLLLGLGVLLGAGSLALSAEPLIGDEWLAWTVGLLAPFVVGAVVAGFQKVKLWDWQFRFDLERFGAAFCVTTGFVLARFVGVLLFAGG